MRPVHASFTTLAIATSVAGIVSLAGGSLVAPTVAQTSAGLIEGTAAFGDWRADRPGTRRLIRPQDLPRPDPAQSVRNAVRIVHRTDQQPIVPNGFEVNLFASGLAGPRLIRTAPNGDVFVAESGGAQFPPDCRGNAFAAEHGSWNRGKRTGYKIIRVIVKDGVPTGEYDDFATGFVINDAAVWGRPVGVAVAKDGSLLVSEDASGTIRRISYVGKAATTR